MKTSKRKNTVENKNNEEEWDLSKGMGIIPDEIPFTQNIGCASGKPKKPTKPSKKTTS